MKHVFAIKDQNATAESAKRILENQVDVLLKASEDIDIETILVYVNDTNTDNYNVAYSNDIPVKFIPTLNAGKKKKVEKQSFASFHNFVANGVQQYLANGDWMVHIQDGTVDLTDYPSERGTQKTRVGEMIMDVNYMMDLLNHPVWFNTASDKGNIKFGHYYTMIDLLNIDDSCLLNSVPNCIMYSGNSNLDWIMIDAKKYREMKMPSLMMNNVYDYDFLSIKELIAKFANLGNGYFDNMFPTVPTEVGVYFRNEEFDRDLKQYNMEKYKDNLDVYKKNICEFKNLKATSIHDVISYVRETLLGKLSEDDKKKLQIFEQSI